MLLKWRQKEQNLGVVLTNLSHISGEEVVKFLQDTLDCLFEILNSNSDMYGEKVFDVLVNTYTCTLVNTASRGGILNFPLRRTYVLVINLGLGCHN